MKYTFDKNFFKVIDSEEKAYWLGFITADGYLNKKGNTLGICLSSKDVSHLEKFKKAISYTGNIFFRKNKYSENYKETEKAIIEIYSTELSKDLNKLGITYTKSLNLKEVKVPKDLMPHFVRGWMDGDGNVHESKETAKQKKYSFGAVGTKDFLNFILNNTPSKVNIYKDKRTIGTYEFQFVGKKRFLEFYNYIYKDATIYLDRKFIKALEIKQNILKSSTTIAEMQVQPKWVGNGEHPNKDEDIV